TPSGRTSICSMGCGGVRRLSIRDKNSAPLSLIATICAFSASLSTRYLWRTALLAVRSPDALSTCSLIGRLLNRPSLFVHLLFPILANFREQFRPQHDRPGVGLQRAHIDALGLPA